MNNDTARATVREHYGSVARSGSSCCGSTDSDNDTDAGGSCCCGDSTAERISGEIGYSTDEMSVVPDGANLGLGCGNPTALAEIRAGDTVVDLGSGGGFDSFLAAQKTGSDGRVIGIDMTPDMLDRARTNAEKGGYTNVEFRLGEIEHLPIADSMVDLIISNCVINLSPEKQKVFGEAFRVLKPGGKVMVSDIVLRGEIPDELRKSAAAYSACIGGAIARDEYLEMMRSAGFKDVEVVTEQEYTSDLVVRVGDEEIAIPPGTVMSAGIRATKPA